MAWAELRGGSWRIGFRYRDQKLSFNLGDVTEDDANSYVASTDELLGLLKRNLVAVPVGCKIEDFLLQRGNPQVSVAGENASDLTISSLWDSYYLAQSGRHETTTLEGNRLHFGHLKRLLKADRRLIEVSRSDLQKYIDQRSAEWIDPNIYRQQRRVKDAAKQPRSNRKPPPSIKEDKPKRHPSPTTIRKEITTFCSAWNWAKNNLFLGSDFPGDALEYAKTRESLPFMTWDEAQHRVDAGAFADEVWECVYLRPSEVTELLKWVKSRQHGSCLYAMLCFAAHTGARRSEIVRASPADLDLASGVVTIREKKRKRKKLTTRQVPLSPFLQEILKQWMVQRPAGQNLFCKDDGQSVSPRDAHNYFKRAMRKSKWRVLRGWHVFRHSFISALASQGTDQRLIDEFVGHSTEEQRRRYRHIFPDVKKQAISIAFG